MNSKSDKTHKNVNGFMSSEGKYIIAFYEYIYDDWRDGYEMEKIVQNLLKPDKYFGFGGWEDLSGTFVKDSIRVDTWWTNMFDYFWEIDTNDDAVKNKVYEWAVLVYEEYKKAENKPGSE